MPDAPSDPEAGLQPEPQPEPQPALLCASWRIDDLARESGLTVDTIRYYQRQGLLPPAEREGRHRVYGPQHVRRIGRIKELQARRFSIAAIRALVAGAAGDETRLENVFADDGEGFRYSYDELVERSEASPELLNQLQQAGVLRDPLEFGRTAYDGDDLEMLRGLVKIEQIGISVKAIRAIAQIYAEGIETTQRAAVDLFATGGDVDWAPGELDELRETARAEGQTMLRAIRRLVEYTHHRTIQRLTLAAVEQEVPVDEDAVDPEATEELQILVPPASATS